MRTAHLFAGAGGGLLADLIIGHEPILAVEWAESCCNSLRERAAEGWFPGLHIHCGDVRLFDFAPWRGRVDCLAAGFPCQDISAAGRGEGISGARSGLVSEVFRAVDVIRPGIVWLENSPRIRTRGRHIVLGELVARGYAWRDGVLGAADVGAPHERDRWWCIAANADGMRQLQQEGTNCNQWRRDCYGVEAVADIDGYGNVRRSNYPARNDADRHDSGRQEGPSRTEKRFEDASDVMLHRLQIAVQCGGLRETDAETIQAAAGYTGAFNWSPPHLGICGMVDGVAAQLDGNTKQARIKAAGNGQVPIAAAAAWMILSGVDKGRFESGKNGVW
ncbi:DNA cytosine methyltransferase [Oryzomonas japonica]|uniref:DNA (cytosine-5-)-methyltransferase n=1 Tax=Oryzomonas japonica TaxID=2603858 RepID=A0A7J4ZR57_9BACT|nr:DNA cytosine methyltransferase [Oryzomonas japonica]